MIDMPRLPQGRLWRQRLAVAAALLGTGVAAGLAVQVAGGLGQSRLVLPASVALGRPAGGALHFTAVSSPAAPVARRNGRAGATKAKGSGQGTGTTTEGTVANDASSSTAVSTTLVSPRHVIVLRDDDSSESGGGGGGERGDGSGDGSQGD